jgi:hypothetical protein
MLKNCQNWRKLAVLGTFGVLALAADATAAKWRPLPAPSHGGMPVLVDTQSDGRIRVRRAGRTVVLDLSREISGCKGRLYDPTTKEEYEGGVDLEIVEETEKKPYTYLILLASAVPNCDVQGACGAGGPNATLLWLKLTRDLSPVGQQGVTIEDCEAERVVKVAGERGDQADVQALRAKQLPWTGDTLQIDFEEGAQHIQHRLLYDRRHPEAGLKQVP